MEIIPVEQKSKLEMHPAGRNNPCGAKEQDKDADNSSLAEQALLLCKSKNNLVAEYSLKDISKPIGVSEYKVTSSLPDDLEKQLPSVEDIQKRIR